MSTHNICFEQKYEKYQNFLSENFHFFVVKISVYLNRHVFVTASLCTRVKLTDVHPCKAFLRIEVKVYYLYNF